MKPFFACVLVFFVALRLAAQDVIVGGPSWVDPSDPPDQLPVMRGPKPDYPERLAGSTEIGYVVVSPFIDAKGKMLVVPQLATDPLLDETTRMVDWRFKPALRAGKPVDSIVRFTIIYNPACAGKRKSDATPRLLSVVVPELPIAPGKNTQPGKVYVTASVDASGQVTKAAADAGASEILGPLAEDAVLKWTFAPARKNGQPVAQAVRLPVVFLTPDNIDAAVDTPPRATYQAEPVYPIEMRRAGLRGLVNVRFIVDIEGRVRNATVISSTNPGLNQPAIDAVLKWRFEPGVRNGVPVKTLLTVPISFQLNLPGSDREVFLENFDHFANITPGGSEPYQVSDRQIDQSRLPPELRYDIPPKPANTVYAVYPFELLRDGVHGTAEVRFLVSPGGDVVQSIVINATRPEFGQALMAMLDEWKFQPAMKDGKPTSAVLDVKQKFSDAGGDVPVSDEEEDLLYELKKEKLELCPPKDLDARPQLISPHRPEFPSALSGKTAEGQAVVEVLVDRDGNVQLPRVVSASDPAFGYAAVQGVAAWKFAPPTSHGKPVVMRVQIPINFHGPKLVPATSGISATQANLASNPGVTGGVQVFNPSGLDQEPVPLFQASPAYPLEAKLAGITGTVVVGFICDTEGRVQDAHVITSSGSSELDEAAVAGVSKWIFKPGRKDGHAVNIRLSTPISFNLYSH